MPAPEEVTFSNYPLGDEHPRHACTDVEWRPPSTHFIHFSECPRNTAKSIKNVGTKIRSLGRSDWGQSALLIVHSLYPTMPQWTICSPYSYSWGKSTLFKAHYLYPSMQLGTICSPYSANFISYIHLIWTLYPPCNALFISYNTAGDNMLSL